VIEWKLVSLYFRRNNFLTGVVFQREFAGKDLVKAPVASDDTANLE
jgi:hypothetical protein